MTTREMGLCGFMRRNWCSVRGFSSAIALILSIGCGEKRQPALFKLLSSDQTGITFANTIAATDSFNVQTDVYIYNGAGVAVGDIDNDGLPDIFFSGNMVSSRLYLNKGGMRFEDITRSAGVTTDRWATGASMVDINGDGLLDIYVSVSGPGESKRNRANLLFVNNGNRTFTEAAAQYGIADTGYTTHAAFLDYDRDGCLDLFLLNNSPKDFSRGVASHPTGMRETTPGSYNELYHNDCPSGKPGKFTNVSARAGILRDAGYGLGVAVSDLNGDGWPDIYVSNDGMPNDVIYVNNRDGTFTNKRDKWLKHASQAGMGVDIADFNDDGRPDILGVDMMPHDLERRKRTTGFQTFESILDTRSRGFRDDYSENSLQLNNGVTKDGDVVFSEIARMAGVFATEWSWSALFADFDNDGFKDIFIGNGYPKAVNDVDYMNAFGGVRGRADVKPARKMLRDLPAYNAPSFVFHNNGDLTFTDETQSWGLADPGLSYGAAYVDLNNDGKLDLVVSNIDGPAFIYENVAPADDAHHYLEVQLVGDSTRRLSAGVGAQLTLTVGGRKQYVYASPYRGFMSSVDNRVHFGLGKFARVDTLQVLWPDGRSQTVFGVGADRLLVVSQKDASPRRDSTPATARNTFFQLADSRDAVSFVEPPSTRDDYSVQPLLPYSISSHGPPLAVGDVNGDGLDDVFIGGSAGFAGRLFLRRKDGGFTESRNGQPWDADKAYDDWGALFFDANGDGKPDLYVSSGGYRLAPTSPLLQDRLYINNGNGIFRRDSAALPVMLASTQAVRAGDFNKDGRLDLFVGGRLSPRKYPYPERSYILRNDGGHFTDVTADVAPDFATPFGMVTDAAWVDFNGDGRVDLIVAGEWMGIEFYANDGQRLVNVTRSMGLTGLRGWWNTLAV
ncbi:MAG TPA: VCBS repeat-containing protein, partial [Gemmatimonadaceae bacterium]